MCRNLYIPLCMMPYAGNLSSSQEPVGFSMFRSLEFTGLVANIDKLSLS
jgi:hypothetical protein